MNTQDRCCTLVPYFEVFEGKMTAFEELCQRFIQQTSNEPKCLYYGFSFNGNQVHCREGYQDAEGVLAHLENVNSLLQEALNISQLVRLEIHGTETELAKLKEPLAEIKPEFFILKYGFRQ